MPSTSLLICDDGHWRVVCVDTEGALNVHALALPDDKDLQQHAGRAAALLNEQGGGLEVLLALPSSWCLSAAIQTDSLGRSGRRQAMAYLLEEQLPISAEDSVSDFIDRHGVALGVSAELDQLRPLVQAIEDAGLVVRHICPLAMLAVGHVLAADAAIDGVLLSHQQAVADQGVDLIEIEHKAPRHWWWLMDDATLRERIEQHQARPGNEQSRLLVIGQAPPLDGVEMVAAEQADVLSAAASEAQKIMAGVASPLIDLRRDALALPGRSERYRTQATALVAALLLLLLCVIGGTYWRAERYASQADDLFNRQVEVFETTLDRKARGSLRAQLTRERDTLLGAGGQVLVGQDNRYLDELYPPSALTHLQAVLVSLPKDPKKPRFQIGSLLIEPDLIKISGVSDSHTSASAVKTALVNGGRFTADDPVSRSEGEGVFSYRFNAYPIKTPAGVSP